MPDFNLTGEHGPIYDVPLIDSLPVGSSGRRQAMPSRRDLTWVRRGSERTAAGYEVLLDHYRVAVSELEQLHAEVRSLVERCDSLRREVERLRKDSQ